MAANPSGQGFQNKNRVAILAELDKEKRKLLMQNQSSTNHPGASIALSRPALNKDFRDHAEQQHIAAQQKAALQTTQEKLPRRHTQLDRELPDFPKQLHRFTFPPVPCKSI
uniref:SOSS complex subunit C n=1 Tax=Bos taurus TaxID=9913 RepID=A0AAA9TIC5_BOVIN